MHAQPICSIVSFWSSSVSLLAVADVMENSFGWKMERNGQFVNNNTVASSIHLTIMPPFEAKIGVLLMYVYMCQLIVD